MKVNAVVDKLVAYDPGHDLPALRQRFGDVLVELGSNENPLGAAPAVLAALRNVDPRELWRYPDPQGLSLRRALAAHCGVAVDEIVLGNGSHELLMLIAQCFASPGDEVLFSQFGFAVFPIGTAAVGATPVVAPALPTTAPMPRGHDLAALAARLTPRTRLVYVANPNNPTGTWFTKAELAAFLADIPTHIPVVVDEAYHEYVDDPAIGTALELRARFPNLIVTRTFSKGYGLAGLRVGYAVASREAVAIVNRLRESFNVNALALLAAEAALGDQDHVARSRRECAAERERVSARLRARGLAVTPSQTNFVLVDFGSDAVPIERGLFEQGVIVRPMRGYGLPTCLRVTIASPAENERLLAALSA
jgi:histidinol-phosphate aminotransferase